MSDEQVVGSGGRRIGMSQNELDESTRTNHGPGHLSTAERDFNTGAAGGADQPLHMESGKATWAMNESNKWVAEMRQLSVPLAAGPSGTTHRVMQWFNLLGVGNPNAQRLACIAYLVPPQHHSVVEVVAGAAGYGCTAVTPGPSMYKNINPPEPGEVTGAGLKYPDDDFRTTYGYAPNTR